MYYSELLLVIADACQATPLVSISKRVLIVLRIFGPTETPCVCVWFRQKWRTSWTEYEFQNLSYEQKRRNSTQIAKMSKVRGYLSIFEKVIATVVKLEFNFETQFQTYVSLC